MRSAASFLVALVVPAALLHCGPSFQAVYECDVRFEHCYAMDQGQVAPDDKKACWRDWLHGYTYGQPRDRVEYAESRYSELSLDPSLPRQDVKEARPRLAMRSSAAPLPADAFKPPPNVVDGHDAGAGVLDVPAAAPVPSARDGKAARAPGAECADGCSRRWTSCRGSCKDAASCDGCDRGYRSCVPACFR
jgi:hypothetical protein